MSATGSLLEPASLGAQAQVFVANIDDPHIEAAEWHHMSSVLRLRPGELVVASDGRGAWRRCVFDAKAAGGLQVEGEVVRVERPVPAVTVGFVPVKGARPDWVVQKLTEVGVDRIVVLRSTRSVVRWEGAREQRALERLCRVAREAAAQSRRAWLPEVDGIVSLAEMQRALAPVPLALAERGGQPPSLALPAVAAGPEGGWDQADLLASETRVGLGERILRAETAAVGAGLLLCAMRGGLVRPTEEA